MASVAVSSEKSLYPIDNVFDSQRGPGGSCWVAADAGEQTVLVSFDAPHAVRSVSIEVEEHESTRTQHVKVSTSRDSGKTYDELLARDFAFTPYGATFGEGTWVVAVDAVTNVRLQITSEQSPPGRTADTRASLTSLVVR